MTDQQPHMQDSPKRDISQLTDVELEMYSQEVETIVAGLSGLDPAQLTPQEREQREQGIQEAIDIGEGIVFEQINRGLLKLQELFREMKERAEDQEAQG